MANDPVAVTVTYRAQSGKEAVARAELAALVADVQEKEPACLGITMLQNETDAAQLLLWERWPSRADFEGEHLRTSHLQAFIARAPTFLAGPPSIEVWRTV